MNKAVLTPFSFILIGLLSACSSGPSAACISADKYINEQREALKQIPKRIQAIEEQKIKNIQLMYESCQEDPAGFLNSPYNYLYGGRVSSCSSWSNLAFFGSKDFDISSKLEALEVERGKIKTRLTTELQINAECYDEDGLLKS